MRFIVVFVVLFFKKIHALDDWIPGNVVGPNVSCAFPFFPSRSIRAATGGKGLLSAEQTGWSSQSRWQRSMFEHNTNCIFVGDTF